MELGDPGWLLPRLEEAGEVFAAFTLPVELALEVDFDCGGVVKILVAFGVGVVVHCHRPPTFIQA